MSDIFLYKDKEYYFVVKSYVEVIDYPMYDENGELVTNEEGVHLTTHCARSLINGTLHMTEA